MAQNFQSSFIPKQPAAQEMFKKQKYGIAGTFALLLFVLSLAGAGGLYFYEGLVEREIEDLKSQLTDAEAKIDKEAIAELSNFNSKLKAADTLIDKHTVVSNFLGILASSTVSSVRFTGFDYRFAQDNTLVVSINGEATSYAAVALQEDIFIKEPKISSVKFSNLQLVDGGFVSFDLDMVIDPKVSVYNPPVSEVPLPPQTQDEAKVEIESGLEELQTTQ